MRYAIMIFGLVGLMFYVAASELKQLPDYGAVPKWAFVNQDSQPFGTMDLYGKPWVANFVFTSCPRACPVLAQSTKKLQDRMKVWMPEEGPATAAIVSFTVDPLTDTPERLKIFGTTFGADNRIWQFARGEYEQMEALVTEGFHQALFRKDRGEAPESAPDPAQTQPTPFDTAHSVHFALVDATGRIRGFYEQDAASLDLLDEAIQRLSP
jgi:protein SCO1/2